MKDAWDINQLQCTMLTESTYNFKIYKQKTQITGNLNAN